MATHKEKIDALTAELAEEKKATKRARTERDKYKAQLGERGAKSAEFHGHLILSDASRLETQWRRASEASQGGAALHYEDGTVELYDSSSDAQNVQRRNAYAKDRCASTVYATGASGYMCTHAKGCTTESFGMVAGGDFTAYVAKDKDGKVTTITLIAS